MSSPFAEHQIVNRVLTPELGSWLLKRPDPGANPDGYTNVLGCRITAADGLLTVTGDFYPTTFAYFGKGHPIACVRWMGSHDGVDSYVAEKARNGSGRDAVTEYDPELAREDLHEMLADDDADDPTEKRADALQAGIDAMVTYEGREGVHEIIQAVLDEDAGLGESGTRNPGAQPARGAAGCRAGERESVQSVVADPMPDVLLPMLWPRDGEHWASAVRTTCSELAAAARAL
jgi:hypothetical protein